MPTNQNHQNSYLYNIISFFTPSKLFKTLFAGGLVYTLASLATQQPDVIVNKGADLAVAGISVVKALGEGTLSGASSLLGAISQGTYKVIWGSADTIKTHLLEYVPPIHDKTTLWSAIMQPYITFYNLCKDMHQWRVISVDLVPFLMPRTMRDDSLVDRFFSYVQSDIYKDREILVNAMANTKIYTNQ